MDKTGATILIAGSIALGGTIDAVKINDAPVNRVELIANERIEVKQVDDTVETEFSWKDQQKLTVKYDMGTPSIEKRIKDVRKQQVITEVVEDGIKVDVILSERPETNRFCYQIDGHENYDFFYQAPLTKEEIRSGLIRPDDIVGSYAVYHKSLKDNEYKTGKVMHIPRPQVWSLSDVDTKVWADLSYNEGELCVTAPQDFLDNAEYPVRIDPTFGYTSAGATTATSESTIAGSLFTLGEAGDVTQLNAFVDVATGRATKMAVYDSTGNLEGVSDEVTLVTGDDSTDVTYTLPSNISLTAADYYLTHWGPSVGGTNGVFGDSTGGTSFSDIFRTYDGSYPDPVSYTEGSGTFKISMYATYEEAQGSGGGGVQPPQLNLSFPF